MSRIALEGWQGLAAMLLIFVAGGCSSTRQTWISTDPRGAKLQVNGKDIGPAPASYVFNFKDASAYDVAASDPGYLDTKTHLTPDSPDLKNGVVKITLPPDEAFAATQPSDAANQWVLVQIDPRLSADAVWQKIVSAISDRYTHLTLLDARSGYLQSDFDSRRFPQPDRGGETVRTQMVVVLDTSQQPLVCKVKIVSQQSYGDAPTVWTDYPRVFPQDVALISQIRSQVGVQ